ncbi:MAG: Na/Pi cotransporter family protein [Lachnospiraceae bacterium]|nr:Na/Pi cotransporter family protein [Lachnospiraceae bacterium]
MTVTLFFQLLGGVGLFLFGMNIMSQGLQNAAGDKLRAILEHVTTNRVMAVFLGIAVTILIQSSSATDMMVIGFVNSGLMEITQAIGVIMGANIGTTVTAQITAFDIGAFAPTLLFAGCIMFLFIKKPVVKHIGSIVMGFGMLFVGISMIKQAIVPLSQSPRFISFLSTLENPFLAVAFGLAFTALLQSSSSSVVIFQAFAIQGILDYHTAVFLVIGAAVGSVTPNILASLTTNRAGKRTALLNLLFNLFRAIILCTLIHVFPQILTAIQSLSPNAVGRQIANTHTIFAITAVIILFPVSKYIAQLTEILIPVLPEETRSRKERQLIYMVDTLNTLPAITIRQAMLECERLGIIARDNLKDAVTAFFEADEEMVARVDTTEEIVDYLCHEIANRLIELRTMELPEADAFRASELTLILSDFERISDHAQNIAHYIEKVANPKEAFSKNARKEMLRLAEQTNVTIDLSIKIFAQENFELLPEAQASEDAVNEITEEVVEKHITRMMKGKCEPSAGHVYTDMSAELERCSDHAMNVAKALIPRKLMEDMELEMEMEAEAQES